MRKMIGITAVVLGVAFLSPLAASADAHSSTSYQRACHNDGIGSITEMNASKRPALSCVGARNVMKRWFDRDDCWEGTCNVRVGYLGYLWKCDAWRAPNQLREYNVWCYSAKQVWVQKYGGYSTSRTVSFTYTD
jgi:hypothetical protein